METRSLRLARDREIMMIERNGDPWFTGEQIGIHLGYADPRREVMRLYKRNKEELEDYSGVVTLTTPGGDQRIRVFSEQGLYILCMLARTDAAREFRRQIAALLQRRRKEKLRQAHSAGLRAGLRQALKMDPAKIIFIRKAAHYRGKGLAYRDVGKLLDCSTSKARRNVLQGLDLGFIEEKANVSEGGS